jgi:hypothetical protein
MQCHELFRGAKLPRSNQKRGQPADEHDGINARQTKPCQVTPKMPPEAGRMPVELSSGRPILVSP